MTLKSIIARVMVAAITAIRDQGSPDIFRPLPHPDAGHAANTDGRSITIFAAKRPRSKRHRPAAKPRKKRKH